MQKLKASVIVPVLNGAPHLEQCFNSILQQSTIPELIVIDGGSTDRTLEIITNNNHHISYWETGKDTGIANAFNRGLQQANGDIIAILNSDDFWEEDTLEIILDAANSYPDAGVFIGQCRLLPSNGAPYVKLPNLAAMKRYMSAYHPATFIRKSTYDTVGAYNERYKYAMDSEWLHRAIGMNVCFQKMNVILANMRMGGLSDNMATEALKEYRISVVQNGIASPAYANLFYWLHRTAKLLDSNKSTRSIKQLINKIVNPTVDCQ